MYKYNNIINSNIFYLTVLKLPETHSKHDCAVEETNQKEGCALLNVKHNVVSCRFVNCEDKHQAICTVNKTGQFVISYIVYTKLIIRYKHSKLTNYNI